MRVNDPTRAADPKCDCVQQRLDRRTRRRRAFDLGGTEEWAHITWQIVQRGFQKWVEANVGEIRSLDAREARSAPFDEECTVVQKRGRVPLREDDQVECGLTDLTRYTHQLS